MKHKFEFIGLNFCFCSGRFSFQSACCFLQRVFLIVFQTTVLPAHRRMRDSDSFAQEWCRSRLPTNEEIRHWRWAANWQVLWFPGVLQCLPVQDVLPSVLWRCWLGSRKGIRPVKNWVVGRWRGYLSGARCRLAYGPAGATATHCLLIQ